MKEWSQNNSADINTPSEELNEQNVFFFPSTQLNSKL